MSTRAWNRSVVLAINSLKTSITRGNTGLIRVYQVQRARWILISATILTQSAPPLSSLSVCHRRFPKWTDNMWDRWCSTCMCRAGCGPPDPMCDTGSSASRRPGFPAISVTTEADPRRIPAIPCTLSQNGCCCFYFWEFLLMLLMQPLQLVTPTDIP